MIKGLTLTILSLLAAPSFAEEDVTEQPQQDAQMAMPNGSYVYTCRSCNFDGRFLDCSCRTSAGDWYRQRALDWGGRCGPRSDVENRESLLTCSRGG